MILSQSDSLIQISDINSDTKWQTVQIQISWLLQKPTDLDLHCLQKQGISGLSRTRVKKVSFCLALYTEVNSQTFVVISCKTIYRDYLCTKSNILVIVFFKNQIFLLFLILKKNADYVEIHKAGNLGGWFSKSSSCSIFLKSSQYCCETSIIQIQQRK